MRKMPVIRPHAAEAQTLQQVTAAIQAGDFMGAQALLEPVLKASPDHADAWHLSGVIHWQRQRFDLAKQAIERAIARNPNHAAYHSNLGLVHKAEHRWEAAATCFRSALRIAPLQAETHYNLALVLVKQEAYSQAIVHCEQVLELKPQWQEAMALLVLALLQRGVANHASGNHQEAAADLKRAIGHEPRYAPAHYNLGNVMRSLGQHKAALTHYAHALALDPQLALAHAGRGLALQELDRLDEAHMSMNTAVSLQPSNADIYSLRGTLHKELGLLDEAVRDFDTAIALTPHNPEPHWNKSLALLHQGNLREAWPLYEWRWKHDKLNLKPRPFSQPLWLGQTSLRGKTILLHAEQGLGDTLQFCRYVPLVAQLGATVVLEVQAPLLSLLGRLEGVHTVVASGSPLPPFDCHCPLMSLPLAFGTDLTSIPAHTPYLHCDSDRRTHWEQRLGPRTTARIGLVWSGNPRHQNDRRRSLPLSELLQMLPSDAHYVSLQKDVREADRQTLAMRPDILHVGEALADFEDTAALCDLMDLVVSVDTSVAHLSGAMGKQTWVILPRNPDWRWMEQRTDSPWYPGMRLVRRK